jgi:hypothetical protein
MPDLKGLLYLADSGETCPVALEWNDASRELRIRGKGLDIQVPAKALSVSAEGSPGTAVLLLWQSSGRARAVVTLTERETIQGLAGLFAAALSQQLDRTILDSLNATRSSRLVLAVLALAVLAAACCAWLFRDSIADLIWRRRAPAIERQLGQSTRPDFSCRQRRTDEGAVLMMHEMAHHPYTCWPV